MTLCECQCGTLYHLDDPKAEFKCGHCGRNVSIDVLEETSTKKKHEEFLVNGPAKMSKWIFLLGSTVGIFMLGLMVPTVLFFDQPVLILILLIIELVFGTLLVCASVSFYLLTMQVRNLQSLMTFHQHNLHIFADQISKLFLLLKKRES